jgi:hypothetical protein
MSAHAAYRRRSLLAAALGRAEAWLLEPVEDEPPVGAVELRPRTVVAVIGLARGCGTTTVARALGAELGARDAGGACVVSCAGPAGAIPLAGPSAGRLARTLAHLAEAPPRAAGRLCLVECGDLTALAEATRYLAPLVLEAGRDAAPAALVSLADHVVLVAAPRVEPALARVVAASLPLRGSEPITALNRALEPDRWEARATLLLPESRMGAQLALGGHEARGELGRAVARLADLCEEPRCG